MGVSGASSAVNTQATRISARAQQQPVVGPLHRPIKVSCGESLQHAQQLNILLIDEVERCADARTAQDAHLTC